MTSAQKTALLDRLSICYNRTNYLLIVCEEEGLADEAAQLARRKARLKLEIDGLLRDLLQSWIGVASVLKAQLDKSNKAVKAAVKEIEKNVKTAENIVKAIGYIDDAIKVAADLVA